MAYKPSIYQLTLQYLGNAYDLLRGRDVLRSDRTTATGFLNDPTTDPYTRLWAEPLELDALVEELENLLTDHPWLDAALRKLCDISEFSVTVKSAVNGEAELAKATRILNRTKENCQLEEELPQIAYKTAGFGNSYIELIQSVDNPREILGIQVLPNRGMVRNTDVRDQFIPGQPCFYQRPITLSNAREFQKGQLLHVRLNKEGRYGRSLFHSGRSVAKDSLAALRVLLPRRMANMPFRFFNVNPGKGIVFTLFQKIKESLSRLLYIQKGGQITPFDQVVGNNVECQYFAGEDAKAGDLKDIEILLDSLLCLIGESRQILGAGTNVNRDVMDEQRAEAHKNRKRIITVITKQFLRKLFDLSLSLEGITPSNIVYVIEFPDIVIETSAEKKSAVVIQMFEKKMIDIKDALPLVAPYIGLTDVKGATERAIALQGNSVETTGIPTEQSTVQQQSTNIQSLIPKVNAVKQPNQQTDDDLANDYAA